jgi:hypothetical protein
VKREIAAGAPVAGAEKADLDDAGVAHVDQLDISPVRLHCRPDQLDHFAYAIADAWVALD